MTTSDDAQSAEAAAEEAEKAAAEAQAAAVAAKKHADELVAAAAAARKGTEADPAPAPVAPTEPAEPATKSSEIVEIVKAGYSFEGIAIEMGALVDGDPVPEAQVRIPLAMLNRHGLVAGATGTGKTKTLQVLAEQISANGVPVFAADIKGDLSGIATPGEPNDKLLARCSSIGQDWNPVASPTEYFALGGLG
ncbi:MAG: helicase HerA-like domain-containing protein, partial [Aeromicrobium sp.]